MTHLEYAEKIIQMIDDKRIICPFGSCFDYTSCAHFFTLKYNNIEILGTIRCGMSRACIVIPSIEHNIVIKYALQPDYDKYNKKEAAIFEKIKDTELEKYFAKFYGNFKFQDVNFYVFQNVGNNYAYLNDEIIDFPIHVKKFLKINHINDVHRGNYVIDNGIPIIFDYAGFGWI